MVSVYSIKTDANRPIVPPVVVPWNAGCICGVEVCVRWVLMRLGGGVGSSFNSSSVKAWRILANLYTSSRPAGRFRVVEE